MNNTEILTLILAIISLLLSIYNLYQSNKKTQLKEKLVCSSLFCSFACESKEELAEHEKSHHE